MKKLGRKINIEEQTIKAFHDPCALCGRCSCGCSGDKIYSKDYDSDNDAAYDPSGAAM
ncbi:CLI_3235 family bacteriocin precursor [Abyssisolibacter fermentans]|uniref:CLI_3235 family bacteriocin precursor n=1 Tax=Abyssisolibacter fermentans TaxID=1766203 RepID=UPI0009EAF944|nr:CLI_3235 family bacteriocin precursor [Abyssisolibacter fermentans]